MRGHIRQRYKGTWNIVLDLGRRVDPATGLLKRVQKWFTVKGTKKQAQGRLTELLHRHNQGQLIEQSKITLGQWLDEWLETAIKPCRRLRSYETYLSVITKHLKPAVGGIRLCDLRASHLQMYYQSSRLSPTTLEQHHSLLHSALKTAVQQDLVLRNVAALVMGKPRSRRGHEEARTHCWGPEEARRFLATARDAGPQPAAFYTLALETGVRKGELCGLKWEDLDADAGTLCIVRQLVKPGQDPIFGPPKNGDPRTLHLSPQVMGLLRRHRAHQAEIKLEFRSLYQDHGLIFSKEAGNLGAPLSQNNLGQREYRGIIDRAGVPRIKFHGLRHTSATLALKEGVPAKVVQERLGHRKITITLDVYAHVLPSMQQDAAEKVAAVLNG